MAEDESRSTTVTEAIQVRYAGARYATVNIHPDHLTITGIGPYDGQGAPVTGGARLKFERVTCNLQVVLDVFGIKSADPDVQIDFRTPITSAAAFTPPGTHSLAPSLRSPRQLPHGEPTVGLTVEVCLTPTS